MLKLGNLFPPSPPPPRAYSKNFGNSWTFSKICFNILHYNAIVRLITYGKQSSSLKKWHKTIHYIFQSWLWHFLLHSNAKKNLVTNERDKKIKPRNFKWKLIKLNIMPHLQYWAVVEEIASPIASLCYFLFLLKGHWGSCNKIMQTDKKPWSPWPLETQNMQNDKKWFGNRQTSIQADFIFLKIKGNRIKLCISKIIKWSEIKMLD